MIEAFKQNKKNEQNGFHKFCIKSAVNKIFAIELAFVIKFLYIQRDCVPLSEPSVTKTKKHKQTTSAHVYKPSPLYCNQ